MDVGITAIGTASPRYRQSQAKVIELMNGVLQLKPAERRLLRAIYQASGIEYRHSVLEDFGKSSGELTFFPNDVSQPFPSTKERMKRYQEHAFSLALQAIQNCLSTSDIELENITHVITVSCTGMYAPGIDIEIIQALQLQGTVQRTAINFMGCYGAFNGMKVAESICRANPKAKVLMVSVELCTLHFQKEFTTDNVIASAIFADGAGALLIEAIDSPKKSLQFEQFYCDLIPQASKEMSWHIADSGFDMVLTSYVPEVIEAGIAQFVERLLQASQLQLSGIHHYAIHPGGMKILQACERALQLTPEQNAHAYHVLRHYGNMSSATILFVLKSLWDKVTSEQHDQTIFSCAFGPGLTLESMLLKLNCVD